MRVWLELPYLRAWTVTIQAISLLEMGADGVFLSAETPREAHANEGLVPYLQEARPQAQIGICRQWRALRTRLAAGRVPTLATHIWLEDAPRNPVPGVAPKVWVSWSASRAMSPDRVAAWVAARWYPLLKGTFGEVRQWLDQHHQPGLTVGWSFVLAPGEFPTLPAGLTHVMASPPAAEGWDMSAVCAQIQHLRSATVLERLP